MRFKFDSLLPVVKCAGHKDLFGGMWPAPVKSATGLVLVGAFVTSDTPCECVASHLNAPVDRDLLILGKVIKWHGLVGRINGTGVTMCSGTGYRVTRRRRVYKATPEIVR